MSTTPKRLFISFAALVGLLLAVYLAMAPRRVRDGSPPGAETRTTAQGAEPTGPIELENGRAPRQVTGPAIPEGVPTLRAVGQIVDARTAAPISGATLTLAATAESLTVQADADGRFQLTLRADLWRMGETYGAVVTGAGGQRLFSGEVVLAPELLIRTRLRLRLRGQLVASIDFIRSRARVQAHLPPAGAAQAAVFLGRAALDAEGRFEIEAWTAAEPPLVRLTFEALSNRLLSVDVPTGELVSQRGATYHCSVGELELRVLDGDRKAVAGARILAFCGAMVDGDSAWIETATDAQGRARLLVSPGRLELCVGREGYSFVHRFLSLGTDLASHDEEIVLHSLTPDECVSGRVLDENGEAVAEALVSGFPRTDHPELGQAAQVGVPSDEDGRFLLPLAGAGATAIVVTAYHEEHGVTAPVVLAPLELDITLRFEPMGGIDVALAGVPAGSAEPVDSVRWVMVGERTFSGQAWGLPFEIEQLPVGTYELYAYLPAAGLFAQRKVTLRSQEFVAESLQVTPVAFAIGTLSRAGGAALPGCSVTLVETDWPAPVVELFGTATTDLEGRFRLPLGPSGRGRAVVRDAGGNQLASLELVAGEVAHLIE